MDRGFYVPGALGEWTVCTSLRLLTLYEQREVRDVPVVRPKALYRTTPVWCEHVEVPRGIAARVPQMVALQGSQLMGEPLGCPYHLILAALWAVEVADVFLESIRHHGHLWRLPMAIRSACADLTAEGLCSADPSARPLLEARLKLLRLTEERTPPDWLSCQRGRRGVFRCSKVPDDEGNLVLEESKGYALLPYGRDIRGSPHLRLGSGPGGCWVGSRRPRGGSRAPVGPGRFGLRPSRPAPSLLGGGVMPDLRVSLGRSTRADASGLPPLGWRCDDFFSWRTPGPPSGALSSLLLGGVGPVWHPSHRQPGHMVEFGAFPRGTNVHPQ